MDSKRRLALNPRQEAAALDPSEALLDESTPVFLNGEMVSFFVHFLIRGSVDRLIG